MKKKKQKQRIPGARHGLHLECKTCGVTSRVGGIEDSKQFSKILAEYKRKHKNHDYELKQSYHAAELGHASQMTNTARQTLATATYTDVTNGSIAAVSFTANKTYLISVTATVDSVSITNGTKVRVVHGTTPTVFDDSEVNMTPATATPGRMTYSWFTVFTQPATAELIKLQFANFSTSTSGIDQVTIVAIKLSDDLTQGTDWDFTETTATTALTTSDSSTNNTTLTFTPGTAGQKWLVMTKSRLDALIATRGVASRIVSAGTVNETTPFCQIENTTVNDFWVWTLARVFTLGAESNTFTEKSFSSVANNNQRVYSGIFYLNLSKLRNVADSYDDSSVQELSTPNYGDNIRTVSITPAVAGDVWTYGFFSVDQNATGITSKGRIQVDDSTSTEYPPNVTTDAYTLWTSKDNTDEPPFNAQGMLNLTAAAHTIDLDGSLSLAAVGRGARCKSLFAVTMELAPAGVALLKQADETAEITEAANKILGLIREVPETQEIVEATNKILNKVQNVSETVETLESINRIVEKTVNVNEALEIVESINRLKAITLMVNETEEITEALNRFKEMVQVVNETEEITPEVINRVGGLIRQISETVDLSEFFNKVLGQSQVKTVDEIEEVTEAINRVKGFVGVVEPAEPEEITEAINKVMPMVKLVNEAVEIGELVDRLSNQVRTINEIQELTEAINKVVTLVQAHTKVADEIETINEVINKILAEVESYGVAGSQPFAGYSQRVNVLLLDAVKSRWNSDYVNPAGGISYPTEADIHFLNTWYTGTRDVEIIFRHGFSDSPTWMRSTDWRLQGRIDTVDVHVFVRGGGGDVEPPILNTVLNGLHKIIASNRASLIPNASVEIVNRQPAPTENPDDFQFLWHVLMKVRVQYFKVKTV